MNLLIYVSDFNLGLEAELLLKILLFSWALEEFELPGNNDCLD